MTSRIALAALSILLLTSTARANDPAVDATISAFGNAFTTGDMKAAKALHVAAPSITDEVAPYAWSGPKAFDTWLADLTKTETAEGLTGAVLVISPPSRENIVGNSAYVIAPATYTFTLNKITQREVAQMTFALTKQGAHWKIASWAWTGAEGVPVKTK